MQLPFVSRKSLEQAVAQKDADVAAALARGQTELRRKLQVQELAHHAENKSAQLVAEALFAIAKALQENTAAQRAASDRIAHSVGAAATAHTKTADVNREWLEVGKGQR